MNLSEAAASLRTIVEGDEKKTPRRVGLRDCLGPTPKPEAWELLGRILGIADALAGIRDKP